ncbi:hypothetical protein FSP39_000476 [Pinctada imbricata]|uniref:Putative hydroxypyruvate isomerase n=1 Tax=Pinctada imbricata TaxID=66713 RepID=A0AA88Y419_PINIB|nr:hypothetical protein FSP39_000476 [Pinctada imbricata]
MKLKFSANLSMMFTEKPSYCERYKAAKDAGFKYVEFGFAYHELIQSLKDTKEAAGVEQVLINAWPGDLSKGEIGIAALKEKQKEFDEKLETTIEYAKALNCKRVHVMAGLKNGSSEEEMKKTYVDNLRKVAARFEKEDIIGLIEPINSRITIPKYYLTDIHEAVNIVRSINSPNLKLQFDAFHIQIMDGNLTENLKKYLPYIGHIQVAQVPDRGEPDDKGEINFRYLFKLLEELNYNGFVGLEYKPRGTSCLQV